MKPIRAQAMAPRLVTGALLSALVWLAGPQVAEAGVDVWTTNGPEGGTVSALAIDPQTPTTLYAGTQSGVFKSTDGGGTWSVVKIGLTGPDVNALAIDPQTPSTLYAGTQSGGVFKSTDAGGTWSATGLTNPYVNALAIDPQTPTTLYASTQSGGVFKSIDAGGTWSATGLTNTSAYVLALAIDPLTPTTLYAATWAGIFKSIDGGGTWSTVNTGLTNTPVFTLAIHPQTPTTLYAGTQSGGVFKSIDGGGTWSAANTGLTNLYVNALAIDPQTTATLYAGTQSGGIFKSLDGGGTWSAVNTGLTSPYVKALAIDPQTPTTFYAGTQSGGVFRSTNGGGTWSAANTGLTSPYVKAVAIHPQTPTTVYAGTQFSGVFKSTDGGGTWSAVNTGLTSHYIKALAIDPQTPTTLYAGTYGASVFKSIDGGGTWSDTGLSDTYAYVIALAIDPQTPTTLFAGTDGGGVFRSTNGGSTWSAVNSGLTTPNVRSLAIDAQTPTTLYAGSNGGGVFKSTDGGGTWSALNAGLTSPYVNALAIDPQTPTTLYAGTHGGGAFKSTDGGGNWTAVNADLTNTSVLSLAIDRLTPTTLYAGTDGGGVFRSANGGGTWSALNRGLTNPYVIALAIDPLAPATVHAGTPIGVFTIQQQDTTPPAVALTSPSDGAAVSGTITVSATASDNGGVAAVRFLLDGVVLGPEDTTAPYEATWDTRGVPDGTHTLTARARDTAGNSATSAPVTVTVANVRRFEETAATLAPAAAWFEITSASTGVTLSGDQAVFASEAGATATFTFTGTAVRWIGFPCEVCGIANVVIDGTRVATVDTFAATRPATSGVMFAASGLAAGTHTLVLEVTGTQNPSSGGTAVIVDAFDVTVAAGRFEETAATLAPAEAWFETTSAGTGVMLSEDRAVTSESSGATATFTFTGTGVSWIGFPCELCGIADVLIDGTRVATVDTFAATRPAASDVMFTASGLPAASHTLVIEVTGTKNPSSSGAFIVADAFDVTSGGPDPPPSDTTPPTVAVTAPGDGATVSGTITVSATASDDTGVTGVHFLLDGAPLAAEDTAVPYEATWDTRMVPDGTYTVTARARDAAGNSTTSGPVRVTLANRPGERFEETAATLAPADAWFETTSASTGVRLSGDRAVASESSGATATFTFMGTGVSWIGFPCELCGIADVLIDGTRVATVDTFAATRPAASGAMFTASGLAAASHTLVIEVTGTKNPSSSGAFIVADAFDVTSGGPDPPPPDTTPPTVAMTAPGDGATVSGTITVSATASDDTGVTGVHFLLDGAPLAAEDTAVPYEAAWDTRAVSDGTYTLTARARDAAGNSTTSAPVTVTVFNDTMPPTVTITSPTAGSTVNGTTPVSADAADNVGVVGLQFKLDGADLGVEDTEAPYSISWDTTTASDGSHSLTAVARDAAGNLATSEPVTLTVANSPPPPPPAVTRFEENDPSMTYTDGWTQGHAGKAWSGGTAALSPIAGTQATFTFTGTSVSWIGFRGPQGGIARVLLDGVLVREVDTYSTTEEVRAVVFTATGLADASHILTIEVTGLKDPDSTNTIIVVDAFDVPAPIVTRFQERDPSIAYSAGWAHGDTGRAWSGRTAAFATAASAQAAFSFTGTSVTWIGLRGPQTGIARVFLDGTLVSEVDTFSTTEEVQAAVFTATGLADASHTLTVEVTGLKDPASTDTLIVVDALEVTSSLPARTGTRFEESDPSVTYTTGWTHDDTSRAWSSGFAAFSTTEGERATFAFTGTSVSWIGLRGPQTGIARVFLDDVLVDEVDTFSTTEEVRGVIFTAAGLADTSHTFTIEVTGLQNPASTNTFIVVDAFDVYN